ncbi:MAG: ribosome-recycling factor [Patescibacteria group bacterium]
MDETQVSSQMDQVLAIFADELSTIRTGRASPALIEGITVEVYGGQQKLRLMELGTISTTGPRDLLFQPWDKTIIREIKNGLLQSGMGLNPIVDDDRIRMSLPPMTTEQRENYSRLLSQKLEASRVMIRNVRSQTRHDLQEQSKEKTISEDDFYRQEKKLQEITDRFIARLEEMASKKEEEIKG